MDSKKYDVLQTVIGQRFTGEETEQVMILVDSLLDEAYNDGAGESDDDGGILHVSKETSDLLYSLELEDEKMIELVDAIWEEKDISWREGYEAALDGEAKVSPMD
jgi:hypothetical protein